jgi:hypothetical protein
MGKDRTNSDSDTELDRKQGNGFARGVPFENPPETVGASHPAMVCLIEVRVIILGTLVQST